MNAVMTKNLQIIGNCLRTTEDRENALLDYTSGKLKIIIDSVFTGNNIGVFFDRTYNTQERFGKVVYRYQ